MGHYDGLRVNLHLYGLADSEGAWFDTTDKYVRRKMGIEGTTLNEALYFKKEDGERIGLTGQYIDDSIECSTQNCEGLTEEILSRFEFRSRTYGSMRFAGLNIVESRKYITLKHAQYVSCFILLDKQSYCRRFRKVKAKMAWFVYTRPYIACLTSYCAQVTQERIHSNNIDKFNKVIKHLSRVRGLFIIPVYTSHLSTGKLTPIHHSIKTKTYFLNWVILFPSRTVWADALFFITVIPRYRTLPVQALQEGLI